MTTYLDIQTAGSHLFPFTPSQNPWYKRVGDLIERIQADMERAKTEEVLRAMPEHLLRDIGLDRYSIRG